MPDDATFASDSPPSGQRPAELIVALTFLAAAGVAVLVTAAIAIHDATALFSYGYFGHAFGVLLLVLGLEVGCAGLGLLLTSWLMFRGDAVGWVLGLILSFAISVGELIASGRSTAGIIALIVSALTFLCLITSRVRTHFSADQRPIGVIAAVLLIGALGFAFGLTGISLITLASFSSRDAAFGGLLVAGSIALFILNRQLRAGMQTARILASIVLVGMAVLLLVVESRVLGSLVVATLEVGTLVGLWAPLASRRHFDGDVVPWAGPRPHVPQTTGQEWVIANHRWLGGALFLVLAAVLLSVGFTGGSTSGFGSATANTVPYTGSSGGVTTTSSPSYGGSATSTTIAAGAYLRQWNLSAMAAGGYTETVKLQVGAPQHFVQGLTNGNDTAGSACSINDSDALIPFALTMTNTTSGFSTYVTSTFGGVGSNSVPGVPGPELDAEVQFSSGATCISSGNNYATLSVDSTGITQPSARSVSQGFFVLTDYYSPNFPNGDNNILDHAVLTVSSPMTFTPPNGTTLSYSVDTLVGPGATNQNGEWSFDLAGTAPTQNNSGVGNSGVGNSGVGNSGVGNSGVGNSGVGNSGVGGPPMVDTSSVAGNPFAASVASTFQTYFGGITTKDFQSAYSAYSAKLRSSFSESSFAAEDSTSTISNVAVTSITDTQTNGAIIAKVTFTSNQSAQYGPKGETCTKWSLNYTLVPAPSGSLLAYQIDSSKQAGVGQSAC